MSQIHSLVSDKYAVRKYVSDRIGQDCLIPVFQVLESMEDFDYGKLPTSFVAKPTNSSGQILLVRDKSRLSECEMRKTSAKWLNPGYYVTREPEYRSIPRRIIIEQFLTGTDGSIPADYKFHCFAGCVEFIAVDVDRFGDHRRTYYSRNWEPMPFVWCGVHRNGQAVYSECQAVPKPRRLEEMVTCAERLSQGFGYIRVDLYQCEQRIYFGELTLSHGGGLERFIPDGYDAIYGAKWDIHSRDLV
jgi:hypothetical protein